MKLDKGSLKITIKGAKPENLLNRAWNVGIELWEISWISPDKLEAWIDYKNIRALRQLAQESECRFRLGERRGLIFVWQRIVRRKFFFLGGILAVTGLFLLSSLIWSVEVKLPSESSLEQQQVLDLAQEVGVKPGMWKFNLDRQLLKKHLESKLKPAFWVGITLQGGNLLLEIAEKKEFQPAESTPCNIVAGKNALVEAVLVQAGTPQVKEGEVVQRGQILISGITSSGVVSSGNLEQTKLIGAEGTVRARVWYESYGESALKEKIVQDGTNELERVILKWDEKEVILKGKAHIPEDYRLKLRKKPFQWRNFGFTVEILREKYLKLEYFTEQRSVQEAEKLARQKALAKLQLASGAKIVQQSETLVPTEENLVRLKVIVEAIEDIGVKAKINQN